MHLNSLACKCSALVIIALVFTTITLSSFTGFAGIKQNKFVIRNSPLSFKLNNGIRNTKFLEVPQIVWGLNNQKIAFARACLTARMMNRTLLMPSLSASLFYKEIDLLEPISFDKVFKFEGFNTLSNGFVQLGQYSDILNRTDITELQKGSGRKWTIERDLDQLRRFSKDPYDSYETIRITGKNPFLWQDHWPVRDYARVFECLVLVDEILQETNRVVSKIREIGKVSKSKVGALGNGVDAESSLPYVAVHMRIEKDWMIHCKKQELRSNIKEICSSKEEIIERVGNIAGLNTPIVLYLAVADSLLEESSILEGWKEGLLPFEKKKLGVIHISFSRLLTMKFA